MGWSKWLDQNYGVPKKPGEVGGQGFWTNWLETPEQKAERWTGADRGFLD